MSQKESRLSLRVLVFVWILLVATAAAWSPPSRKTSSNLSPPSGQHLPQPQGDRDTSPRNKVIMTRRSAWEITALGVALSWIAPSEAKALVKGNAPPPPKKSASTSSTKCTNVEECQAQAEEREARERAEREKDATPASSTPKGTKYRDMIEGNEALGVATTGKQVTLRYKVLKLGKRSYDGLSGEGTVVFSRGYGLEDDEQQPGDKAFITTLGSTQNIEALNDAVVGMKVGGTRRIRVLPADGWRKPGKACDGGPGGAGSGGELKTDYLVVPTATMVAEEACFDATKLPYPATYAQLRRKAQRFDQSLILEVQLVAIQD